MPVQVAGPRFAPVGVPTGAILAEDDTYLLAENDTYIESESGVGGKISTYPLVTVADPADVLVGNAGGVTSRFVIAAVNKLTSDLKTYMPRGTRMASDSVGYGVTGNVNSTNVMCYFPIFVPEACTLTEIGSNCAVAQASSLLRLGLYTLNGISGVASIDSDLVADFGTISGASTGDKSISVSQAVTRGWYLMASAHSNHTTVRWRKVPAVMTGLSVFGEASPGNQSTAYWRKVGTDYSGGLPDPATVDSSSGGATNQPSAVIWSTFT